MKIHTITEPTELYSLGAMNKFVSYLFRTSSNIEKFNENTNCNLVITKDDNGNWKFENMSEDEKERMKLATATRKLVTSSLPNVKDSTFRSRTRMNIFYFDDWDYINLTPLYAYVRELVSKIEEIAEQEKENTYIYVLHVDQEESIVHLHRLYQVSPRRRKKNNNSISLLFE